jgi:DNA-binding IclR family transcriptional regulator
MRVAEQKEGSGVRAADTVLAALEAVAWAREPVGVTQIAQAIGATKSAVFRHLQTLMERGYLTQDADTNRFRLGPKAFLIGHLAPPAWDVARTLERPMRDLRDATGLAVVLSTPSPRGALVVATFPGTHAIEIGVRPGSELALHASAQGKVFLAFGPQSLADRVLAAPLPAFTDRTVTGEAALREELSRIRLQGYALAPEEALLGINALAAPLRDHRDAVVGAVALVGSIQHLAPQPGPGLIEAIIRLAEDGSRLLGHGLAGRSSPGGGAYRAAGSRR